jgi:hypothetical protein
MFASLPPATRRAIRSSTPESPFKAQRPSLQSTEHSSGYITVTSSWDSENGFASPGTGMGGERERPPLAWTGVRHKLDEGVNDSIDDNESARAGESDVE